MTMRFPKDRVRVTCGPELQKLLRRFLKDAQNLSSGGDLPFDVKTLASSGGDGAVGTRPSGPSAPAAQGSSGEVPEAGTGQATTAATIAALAAARRPLEEVELQIHALNDIDLLERYVTALVAEQEEIVATIASTTSSDARLLSAVDESRRGEIAEELLRAKYGASREDAALAAKRVEFEEQRVRHLEQLVEYSKEFIEQRRAWRRLSRWAPWLLLGSLAASLALTTFVLALVGDGSIDGWQGGLLIFVLALVAVSPATLLLVERPLRGIDSWKPAELKSPSAATADSASEEDGSGAAGKSAG
ncbi:hypothetical protein ARHIZOSPH14_06510 [Agromyces rhizosphaerae]|uniref:Uncharacterized protein n=1 Tax=Agromyces rhizosphaerae TaxID=88374 RepID=A0A9W6CW44_9MICO|nr:hypothetical protein [Agromyces rhizosphaerae]GLI26409.1 hypothetical protein ARHIZOSPH14_06510 [Agromyces rhizosphaerae]